MWTIGDAVFDHVRPRGAGRSPYQVGCDDRSLAGRLSSGERVGADWTTLVP
ncbi:hypothetical protein ACWDKQ_26280 [Saccharopolyspora sp. NPDC000995]